MFIVLTNFENHSTIERGIFISIICVYLLSYSQRQGENISHIIIDEHSVTVAAGIFILFSPMHK